VPGIVCYGDSGAPTFFNDRPLAGRSHERVVAVASDGGNVCFSRDDRARVDTTAAQDWIRQTIADVLGLQRWLLTLQRPFIESTKESVVHRPDVPLCFIPDLGAMFLMEAQ
jgi:hypothetical protein